MSSPKCRGKYRSHLIKFTVRRPGKPELTFSLPRVLNQQHPRPPRFLGQSSVKINPDFQFPHIKFVFNSHAAVMYNGMLRHYGIATPTSLTPVHHPEDAQPNERGSKRTQKAPPRIAITAPPRGDSNGFPRGGYRGRSMYRGGPFTQYAVRGNSSWREGGRGQGHSRGATRNTVMNNYQQVQASGIGTLWLIVCHSLCLCQI